MKALETDLGKCVNFQEISSKTDQQNMGRGWSQGEFPEIGPVSVLSCPRGLGISLDPHLFSFWLVPGASGMAQEESPSITGRGRWETPEQTMDTYFSKETKN